MLRYLKENVNGSRNLTEGIKRSQMEILEMKMTISGMTNPFKGISSRLGIAEERHGEPEDITIETIQTKAKRQKRPENMKTFRDLRIMDLSACLGWEGDTLEVGKNK